MKAVLLKSTSPSTIANDLRNYISAEFGSDAVAAAEPILEKVHTARVELVSCTGFATVEGSLRRLTEWLGIIDVLQSWLGGNAGRPQLPSAFKWNDCLQRTHWEERKDLRWEKINVLHNYGALQSYLGCTAEAYKSTDSTKQAIKNFQSAAGVFQHLREEVMPTILDTVTRDLRDPVLSQQINLMLAQAQQCCYQKACNDKLAPTLLCKLAVGVANFYEAAYANAKTSAPGYLEPEMIAWLNVHSMSFRAAGHYHRAVHDSTLVEQKSVGYGKLICRLRIARKLLDACHKAISANALIGDIEELTGKVTKWLSQLEKDNEFVYVELIPSEDSLEELVGLQNVSASKFDEAAVSVKDANMESSLAQLVPTRVLAVLQRLKDRCQRNQAPIAKRLAAVRGQVQTVLSDNKLLVDSVRHMTLRGVTLSDACWQTIVSIQAMGGVEAAVELMHTLETNSDAAHKRLNQLATDLYQYERDARAHEFNSFIRELQSKLQTAQRANSDVSAKLRTVKKYGAYMQLSRDELNARLKQKATEDNSLRPEAQPTGSETQLAQLVSQLDTLVEDCDKTQAGMGSRLEDDTNALKQRISNGDVIADAKQSAIDTVVEEYDVHCSTAVSAVEETARALLANVRLQIAELEFERRHAVPQDSAATRLLSDIEVASTATLTGLSEAADGRRFFNDLHERTNQVAEKMEVWIASGARLQLKSSSNTPSPYASFTGPPYDHFRL